MMLSKSLFAFAIVLMLCIGCHASCNVDLNSAEDDCLAKCVHYHAEFESSKPIFICDKTNPWLHHYSANAEFLPATPPAGTGAHEYAVYRGGNPPCAKNGKCPGCGDPQHHHLCSVFVDPETCQVTCEQATTGTTATATVNEDSTSAGTTASSVAALGVLAGAALAI